MMYVRRLLLFGNSYANRVLATNPIAFWQQNEGSGSVMVDSSGNGFNGTYTGVTWDGTLSPVGEAVPYYDGVNDYADAYSTGLASAFNFDELSILMWVSCANWSEIAPRRLLYFVRNGSNFLSFYHGAVAGNITCYRVGNSSVSTVSANGVASGTAFVPIGFTCTLVGNAFKGWFNGAQLGTTQNVTVAATGSGLSVNEVLIGARTKTPTEVWPGYICNVAIWDYALSSATMIDLMAV